MNEKMRNCSDDSLRRHQEILYELLEEFDRICRKHGIPYQLFAGSALGAVRHGGIIPWDDDLDVVMLREDYLRFLEAAPGEVGPAYYIQAEQTEHWPMVFSKLRKNGTACIERYIPKDPLTHCGIYIDIFPCDNLAGGIGGKLQFLLSKAVIARALDRRGYATDSRAKKLVMCLSRILPVKLFARLVWRRKDDSSAMVHTFFGGSSGYEKSIYPRAWFTETVMIPFGRGMYPVSAHYDAMLTRQYGDYMTPLPEHMRGIKVHAQLVDPERSYEEYWQMRQDMKITEYTRSIR